MITEKEKEMFKDYKAIQHLLDFTYKKRYILKMINKYNEYLKRIDKEILDSHFKIYLWKLIKENFTKRLTDSSLLEKERTYVANYYKARLKKFIPSKITDAYVIREPILSGEGGCMGYKIINNGSLQRMLKRKPFGHVQYTPYRVCNLQIVKGGAGTKEPLYEFDEKEGNWIKVIESAKEDGGRIQ